MLQASVCHAGAQSLLHIQDVLPKSIEEGGLLTPIAEQSAAELGSEASQLPAKSAPPQGEKFACQLRLLDIQKDPRPCSHSSLCMTSRLLPCWAMHEQYKAQVQGFHKHADASLALNNTASAMHVFISSKVLRT